MTIPVLIILGVLWAAVLVPPLLRARSDKKTGAIGDYAHTLGVLKTSNKSIRSTPRSAAALVDGSAHLVARSKNSAMKKRRKDVLKGLIGSVLVLGITALITRQVFISTLFVLALACLGVYVYLLYQINMLEQQKKMQGKNSGNQIEDGF